MIFSKDDLKLRAISGEEDYKFLYDMRTDKGITDNLFSVIPFSYDQHVKNIEKLLSDPKKLYFIVEKTKVIELSNNDIDELPFQNTVRVIEKTHIVHERIGIFRIVDIDHRNRIAEVGGDLSFKFRGKGLGKKLWSIGMSYAFEELNLRKLYLYVFEFNKIAKIVYNIVGFKETGLMKEHIYRNGKYHDVSYMEYLRSDNETTNN